MPASIPTTLDTAADELRRDGATVIFVAVDGKAAGVVAVADPDQGHDAGGASLRCRPLASASSC